MKNRAFNYGAAVYAVVLLLLAIGQIVPLLTGKSWAPETRYIFRCVAVGVIIFSTGMLATQLYQMFRAKRLRAALGEEWDGGVQEYILRYAEDLYRQQGYFNQGSFSALHIARQYSVEEKDPLIEDAMLALVEGGKLVPHRIDRGTVYVLAPTRQLQLILEHDLPTKWQQRGADFLPNNPLVGEIQRVKTAVAAKQRQQVNS